MHAVVDTKLAATPVTPAKLAFEQVGRRYGGHAALEGFSLAIAPGEVVCLLGASGSGKTTLLRIASGIETPTGGRVLIDGEEVAGPARFVPPERRNVGLMFQDFALFPHLTVRDNVAFGLRSLPRGEAARLALAGLERVGLARYADAYPHILSGGEQQRVALARALAPRPAVMLMDEPFSGLDVALRERLQEDTLALLKERQATCLIVTHAPAEAIRTGDRIAVMHAGRIVQAGSAEALYRHPASLLVARLFSAINEVPLTVAGGAVHTPAGVFPAPGLGEGAPAVLCIRHRAITIGPAGQGLPGRVLRARFLGDQALMEIAAQGFERPLTALLGNGAPSVPDAEISVTIDPHDVMVLPAHAAESE
jgi:iron(III) transport system ATP-binding protein